MKERETNERMNNESYSIKISYRTVPLVMVKNLEQWFTILYVSNSIKANKNIVEKMKSTRTHILVLTKPFRRPY